MVNYKLFLITADNKLLVTDGNAIIELGYAAGVALTPETKKDAIKDSLKSDYDIDISKNRIVICIKDPAKQDDDNIVFVIISSSEKDKVTKKVGANAKFIALKDKNDPLSTNPDYINNVVNDFGSENLGKCLKDAKTKLSSTLSTNNDDDYVLRTIYFLGIPIRQERVRRRSVNYMSSIVLPPYPFYVPNVRYSSPKTKMNSFFNDLNEDVSKALQSSSGSPKVPRSTRSSPNSSPKMPRQRTSPRSSPRQRTSPRSPRSRRGGYYEKYMKYKLKYLALKKQLF